MRNVIGSPLAGLDPGRSSTSARWSPRSRRGWRRDRRPARAARQVRLRWSTTAGASRSTASRPMCASWRSPDDGTCRRRDRRGRQDASRAVACVPAGRAVDVALALPRDLPRPAPAASDAAHARAARRIGAAAHSRSGRPRAAGRLSRRLHDAAPCPRLIGVRGRRLRRRRRRRAVRPLDGGADRDLAGDARRRGRS